jgi:hypothetical protein
LFLFSLLSKLAIFSSWDLGIHRVFRAYLSSIENRLVSCWQDAVQDELRVGGGSWWRVERTLESLPKISMTEQFPAEQGKASG